MTVFLMVTHGTAGDVLPFLRIGRALVACGHEVTLFSHAPYAARAARAGITFVPIDTEASYDAHLAASPDLLNIRGGADLRAYYRREGLVDQFHAEITGLVRHHRPGRTVLVGRHTSALSVLTAAELLGAPAAWVAMAPAQTMLAPVASAYLAHGLADDLDGVRRSLGLAPVADWASWFGAPDLLLGLWPHWFDTAGTPGTEGVELTGFVLGDDDTGPAGVPAATGPGTAAVPDTVATMLAAPQRPVLVTGGTGQLLHPRFYASAVSAVAAAGRIGLVVAPHRSLAPRQLPEGWHWEPRLPFPEVLPRIAALVHHGGIGTAVRALRSGTPQVILAHGADRPDNAARLAAFGLAWWQPARRWTPADLAAPLARALTDVDYPDRAAVWAAAGGLDSGPERAASALQELARRGSRLAGGAVR